MTRSYALYFDRQPINVERRAKQTVAIGVIALHLLVFLWALRTHPYIASTATSLVVIQLNSLANVAFADHVKHDVKAQAKPASNRAKPTDQRTHDLAPAGGIDRAPVAEGRGTAGTSDDSLRAAGTMSANSVGAADSPLTNRAAAGNGSIFGRFHPPQVIHRAQLTYPKEAILADQHGDVDVLVTVSAEGKLLDASIDKSSGSAALDAASLKSIRLYEFKAAEKDGMPVQADAIINVEWRLSERERQEFSRLPAGTPDINLDAQLKSIEFLGSMPSHRLPCEQMKNPDCLPAPSGE
jgi:TonB family protein